MFDIFKDKEKENKDEATIGVEKKITITGPTLGDTKTVIISPNGKEVRIIKGGF